MSSESERQTNNVIAPAQSATPADGVTILVATTTAKETAVPYDLFGSYVYLQAEGDKIWFNFGPAATPIDKTSAGGDTFALGTALANAVPLPNGARIPVRLDKKLHATIKWQADATTSKLIIYRTTPKLLARAARG